MELYFIVIIASHLLSPTYYFLNYLLLSPTNWNCTFSSFFHDIQEWISDRFSCVMCLINVWSFWNHCLGFANLFAINKKKKLKWVLYTSSTRDTNVYVYCTRYTYQYCSFVHSTYDEYQSETIEIFLGIQKVLEKNKS